MRKLLMVSIVVLLVAGVFGCGGPKAETGTSAPAQPAGQEKAGKSSEAGQEMKKNGIPRELAAVVEHFRNKGLKVDDIHLKSYENLGAVGGIGLTVEGGGIELYLFNPATADAELKKNLENARNTGKFMDKAINREIPVVMNGNIMLFGLEVAAYVHPAKEKIVEAFMSL